MNWLAFVPSFVVTLCIMLLWQGFDTWTERCAPRLRLLLSGPLFLAIAIPGVWFLPNQSRGVFFGALTGLLIAGDIDVVRRRQLRKRTA